MAQNHLDENLRKVYSLGQCIEMLKEKLKDSTNWTNILTGFNVLGLTDMICVIILKTILGPCLFLLDHPSPTHHSGTLFVVARSYSTPTLCLYTPHVIILAAMVKQNCHTNITIFVL